MAAGDQSKLEKMEAQLAAMRDKLATLDAEVRAKAIALVQALMAEHKLTGDDIGIAAPQAGRVTRKRTKTAAKKTAAVAAKYQDPKTGATWSGRGREPGWIKGKKREKFLIAE